MEQFDEHFGALFVISTGSTAMMEALAKDTTMQYDIILASMAELKTLSIAVSATTVGGNRDSATGRLSPDKRTK